MSHELRWAGGRASWWAGGRAAGRLWEGARAEHCCPIWAPVAAQLELRARPAPRALASVRCSVSAAAVHAALCRTPLNGIIGLSNTLLSDGCGEPWAPCWLRSGLGMALLCRLGLSRAGRRAKTWAISQLTHLPRHLSLVSLLPIALEVPPRRGIRSPPLPLSQASLTSPSRCPNLGSGADSRSTAGAAHTSFNLSPFFFCISYLAALP